MNNFHKFKECDVPDFYSIQVKFVNRDEEKIDVVSHQLISNGQIMSYLTKENTYGWLPVSNIETLKFDKNWTELVEKAELEKRNKEKAVSENKVQ